MAPATATLRDARTGDVVCDVCELATTPLRRMRGLLGRDRLDSGQGMFIRPACAVHTWFMRFPIDAVFLTGDLEIVRVAGDLRPWRAASCRRSRSVLELPAGEAAARGLEVGATLRLQVEEAA